MQSNPAVSTAHLCGTPFGKVGKEPGQEQLAHAVDHLKVERGWAVRPPQKPGADKRKTRHSSFSDPRRNSQRVMRSVPV